MGKTSKGIMGNISGTVGTVVGATWRGKAYLRSKPDTKKNAQKSDSQLAQQAKCAIASTMVSQGNLLNAFDAKTATLKEAIQFNWTNNSNASNADDSDKVLMVAYCPEFNCTVYRIGAVRSTGSDTLQLPGFSGRLMHTWVSFISADEENIATSLYTGQVTVT